MSTHSLPETTPHALGWPKRNFAAMLGKSERTLDRWAERRIGPPRIRVGNMVFYPQKAYEEWLEAEAAKAAGERV